MKLIHFFAIFVALVRKEKNYLKYWASRYISDDAKIFKTVRTMFRAFFRSYILGLHNQWIPRIVVSMRLSEFGNFEQNTVLNYF